MKRKQILRTIKLMIGGGGFEFLLFYFWRITLMLWTPSPISFYTLRYESSISALIRFTRKYLV